MPLYTYGCPEHGLVDLPYPMGTAPEQALCTNCGQWMNRQYGGAGSVGVIFKGSGYYSTDNRKGNNR